MRKKRAERERERDRERKTDPMKLRELEVHIRGMTSSACVNLIESVLSSENGIQKVSVNLIMDCGVVVYDSDVMKGEGIVEIVKELGYGVDVISEKDGCALSFFPFSFSLSLSFSLPSLILSCVVFYFPQSLRLCCCDGGQFADTVDTHNPRNDLLCLQLHDREGARREGGRGRKIVRREREKRKREREGKTERLLDGVMTSLFRSWWHLTV